MDIEKGLIEIWAESDRLNITNQRFADQARLISKKGWCNTMDEGMQTLLYTGGREYLCVGGVDWPWDVRLVMYTEGQPKDSRKNGVRENRRGQPNDRDKKKGGNLPPEV